MAKMKGAAASVTYRCSFCGKDQQQVHRLIAGPGGVYICDECVDLCREIIGEEQTLRRRQGEAGAAAPQGETPAPQWVRSGTVRCHLYADDLEAVQALAEAGIQSSIDDAAAWLIHAGIEANKELFARVAAITAEMRRLRSEAHRLGEQVGKGGEPSSAPPTVDSPTAKTGGEPPQKTEDT